jgi:hypothetical protein
VGEDQLYGGSAYGLAGPVSATITINGVTLAIAGNYNDYADVYSTGLAVYGSSDTDDGGGIATTKQIFTQGNIPGLPSSLDDSLATTAVTGYASYQYLQMYTYDYNNDTTVHNALAYLNPATLTIANVSAVPEPATWGMFLLGFGAIGWTLRARRNASATTAQI